MFIDIYIGMYIDAYIGLYIDMYIGMYIDVCIVWECKKIYRYVEPNEKHMCDYCVLCLLSLHG